MSWVRCLSEEVVQKRAKEEINRKLTKKELNEIDTDACWVALQLKLVEEIERVTGGKSKYRR